MRRSPRAALVAAALACLAAACASLGGLSTPSDGGADDAGDAAADQGATGPDATGADAGGGPDASNDACPTGRGPTMARAKHGCIDTTEVTQAQYAVFLADSTPPTQPSECAFNTTFVPGQQKNGFVCSASLYDPINRPNAPVRCVDWCDATAFCAWAGKRLCGALGGGAVAMASFADAAASEWTAACTDDGARAYPYGIFYGVGACHDSADAGLFDPFDVASAPSCVGGVAGVFDMSGNVAEWEDSCSGSAGDLDSCRLRGGDLHGASFDVACAADRSAPRGSMGGATGFRCCAD